MLEIASIQDLARVQERLVLNMRCFYLDDLLLGIRLAEDKIPSFISAGLALFAVRFSSPRRLGKTQPVQWNQLKPSVELITSYLVADPIAYDDSILDEFYASNPVFVMLRLVASQFPFQVDIFARHAQPYVLYGELPEVIRARPATPDFDLHACFERLNGVTLREFIDVGFVTWIAARAHAGFTLGYYDKARAQGMRLPADLRLQAVLNNISAEPEKLCLLYERRKETDRRYGLYDFNPLFEYPLIRPWPAGTPMGADLRMSAPVPDLVAHRISTGIFYQMYNEYGLRFADYFGFLLQEYVGEILRNSVPSSALTSEEAIRSTYTDDRGPVPDWIILEGNTAVFIECKATRFSRAALATGNEAAIDSSLKQILKGLRQGIRFKKACQQRKPGLENLSGVGAFCIVFVSLEPLHLVNSHFFRQYIDELLAADALHDDSWVALSIQDLEMLQPHLAAGISISEIIRRLRTENASSVLNDVSSRTGLSYKNSFLYEKDRELYERLQVQ
jgi:hypothetical protein